VIGNTVEEPETATEPLAAPPDVAPLPDAAPLGESLFAEHAAASTTSTAPPATHAAGRIFRIPFLLCPDRVRDLDPGLVIWRKLARRSWHPHGGKMNDG
jgi:hypothetical protein